MKTIGQMFAKGAGVPNDALGLELELEGNNNPPFQLKNWKIEHDGSLRDRGLEYVLNKPRGLEDSKLALQELRDAFVANNNQVKDTNLASTHIHLNVNHMKLDEFINLIGLFMMFEVCIAKAAGKDRYMNYFAVSTGEGGAVLRELLQVRTDDDFRMFIKRQVQRDWRYSGLNFVSIRKYGTLEVRYLGAKPNPLDVVPWIEFFDKLRTLAMDNIDWHMLFEMASGEDMRIFQEEFNTPFEINHDDLLAGIRQAQDLVFPIHHDCISAPENGNGVREFFNNL